MDTLQNMKIIKIIVRRAIHINGRRGIMGH